MHSFELLSLDAVTLSHLSLPPEPGPVAKSNIILDVKPWDDETGGCGLWAGPDGRGLNVRTAAFMPYFGKCITITSE